MSFDIQFVLYFIFSIIDNGSILNDTYSDSSEIDVADFTKSLNLYTQEFNRLSFEILLKIYSHIIIRFL